MTTAMATVTQAPAAAPTQTRVNRWREWPPRAWPLPTLYVLFPLWWVLGLSHFIFLILAVPMAWELVRRRPVVAPTGFGLWLLFLVVGTAGGLLLWVAPPGTVPVHGVGKLLPFGYRLAWYAAITIVALYILNLPERDLSSDKIVQLLGLMFVYTTLGGIAGLLVPNLSFPSALELAVHVPRDNYLGSLIHPSLATASEFLGYDQPRPSAPFAYANAWGNNLGLFLPFLIAGWLRRGAGWRRPVAAIALLVAVVPIAYSLNRGLWAGLIAAVVLISLRLAFLGRIRTLQVTMALLVGGGVLFVASPLYDTVTLRVNTPHSNERRETVATTVIGKTLDLSPVLGYGDTRMVSGSFASIAGGETPTCQQCAAPPLGTQGFMWRLVFTTGLLGTLLFLSFTVGQLVRFFSASDPIALTGCLVIFLALLFSFVYDSLESPLFTMMMAIGLLNRRFVRPGEVVPASPPGVLR